MTAYQEYLRTPVWKDKREKRLIVDDNKCYICRSGSELDVHHVNYPERWGDESVFDDLITLCRKCHYRIHEQMGAKHSESMAITKAAEEELRRLREDFEVALVPVRRKYTKDMAKVLETILSEYNKDEWKRIQKIAKMIRNYMHLEWDTHPSFEVHLWAPYEGESLHQMAVQGAASRKKEQQT